MGRKRHRKSRDKRPEAQSKASWDRGDVSQMLAWLTFTGEKDSTGGLFRATIVRHLKATRKVDYDIGQVNRKVASIWASKGRDLAAKKLEEFYEKGINSLEFLDDLLRQECQSKLDEMKSQELAEKLSTPRQLRSVSRTPESSFVRNLSRRLEISKSPSPCPDRHRFRTVRSASAIKSSSRRRQQLQILTHEDNLKTPKVESFTTPCRESSSQLAICDSQEEDIDHSQGFTVEPQNPFDHHRRSTSSTISHITYCGPAQPAETDHFQEASLEHQKFDENAMQVDKELSRAGTPCECKILREQLESLRKELDARVNFHRLQATKAAEERERLKRELTCLKSSYNQIFGADDQSKLRTLTLRQMEIKELKTSLDQKQRYRELFRLSAMDPVPLDAKQIREEMNLIAGAIKQILANYEHQHTLLEPNSEIENDMRLLLCRSFALDSSKAIEFARLEMDSSPFALQALLRSLTAAAICEWVFEADTPVVSNTSDALLEQYRLHLAVQDGQIALRNLDLAAHQSLFREDVFQKHIIPTAAAYLGERFSRLIERFLTQTSYPNHAASAVSAWSREVPTLIEIFGRALIIKTCAMISKDLFEVMMYAPGVEFDPGAMVPETIEGDQAEVRLYKDPNIQICILPALRVYEDDRRMVSNMCFSKGAQESRSEPLQLTRAVVILDPRSSKLN